MDIDVDIVPGVKINSIIPEATAASTIKNGSLVKHPVGWYFQRVPRDEVSQLCAIPYDVAPSYGMFKIDFINLHILSKVESKDELRRLINTEPNWDMLLDDQVVTQLFHLGNHFDLVSQCRPKSIDEIADCLALIRPGKRELLSKYMDVKSSDNPQDVREFRSRLFAKDPTDPTKYTYKKSHAIAYAHVVVLQMHLLSQHRYDGLSEQLEW